MVVARKPVGLSLVAALGVAVNAIAPFSGLSSAIAQTTGFSDVQPNNWAAACIGELAQRQIIKGYPDGRFRPADPVTRAEFAALLRQGFPNQPQVREAIGFVDVPSNYWAAAAIQEAYRRGFLSGYPDRKFIPTQSIPRVQALVALASGLKYAATQPTTAVLNAAYADAGAIPDYARNAVAAATEKNLVVNYPKIQQLEPTRFASRAEIATFLCQALQPGLVPTQYIANTQQFSTETKTAEEGNVRVQLTYRPREPLADNFRIQISRSGQTVLEAAIPVDEELQRFSNLEVRDLDGDQEPEVVVDLFSGGAYCCTSSYIYGYNATQNAYRNVKQFWGSPSYRLEDLDQDNLPEFVSGDPRFDAQFTAHAASGLPIQIWQYRRSQMQNVTRSYPKLIYEDAVQHWQNYTFSKDLGASATRGFLAAYLADKHLLGQGQEGWQLVQQAYPYDDRRQYFIDLRDFLQKNGYITTTPQ
ncbi:S-layer homology domain-containing protein [Trichocoleus sp. FACHB-591]|uniref:S-layer homology domain-containing protein n=1 Tax=Trichocoleus sp. FACHB-591 TaxID=2692872 RepID=UPI00351C410B